MWNLLSVYKHIYYRPAGHKMVAHSVTMALTPSDDRTELFGSQGETVDLSGYRFSCSPVGRGMGLLI
jgi:hypothetical protein